MRQVSLSNHSRLQSSGCLFSIVRKIKLFHQDVLLFVGSFGWKSSLSIGHSHLVPNDFNSFAVTTDSVYLSIQAGVIKVNITTNIASWYIGGSGDVLMEPLLMSAQYPMIEFYV